MCCACRRVEAAEAARRSLSREELELLDVQRQMEEQLAEQYTQVRTLGRPDRGRSPGDSSFAVKGGCICETNAG